MGHQVADADRLLEALVLHLQVFRQVEVYRPVEPHVAGLDLLHHRDPGEGLGDGGQPEEGRVRVDRPGRRQAGDAIALLQDDLTVLHHRDGDPGDVVAGHAAGHQAVHIGFQFGGRDRLAGRDAHAGRRRERRLGGGRRGGSGDLGDAQAGGQADHGEAGPGDGGFDG
jgi:hypothetical protein